MVALGVPHIIVCGHTDGGIQRASCLRNSSAAMLAERLSMHGWVYEIDTGEVWAYDPSLGEFALFPT